MIHFNSNRFEVTADNLDAALGVLDGLSADSKHVGQMESYDVDGNQVGYAIHLSGTGNPVYKADGVPAGIAKLTGNMDAFYADIQQLLLPSSSLILSVVNVADDGWISAKGVTVSTSSIVKRDLVGELISDAGEILGNPQWTTDTHAIENEA